MQVSERKVAAGDEHRVEDPAALGQVLDVLVAAILPPRRGARGFTGDAVEVLGVHSTENGVFGQRCQGQRRNPIRIGGNQCSLPVVPAGQ